MQRLLVAGVFTLSAFAVGCDQGPKLYRVTGTIKWKGDPIPNGRINFIAEDGMTTPASAKIENGRFEVRTTAGVKRVEILNQRDKGFDKVMNQHTFANDIPAEYNSETKLRFDVKPNDDNELELSLPQK